MTAHGSEPAIPPNDAAWDPRADAAFHRALPVILEEVFGEPALDALAAAIVAGAEELILGVEISLEGLEPRCLAGNVFDPADRPPIDPSSVTIALLDLRPDTTILRIPLVHEGVRLAELVAVPLEDSWIEAQRRAQLRVYADLTAPLLFTRLEADELRRAALTDQLTGLANRRALDHELEQLCAAGTPLCLLLLDVDGLKEVNDVLGYEQGDRLITTLARTIGESVSRPHVAARMGGDEFIVILPDATEKQARKQVKRLTRRFARQPLPPRVAQISGGVSVGVIEARPRENPHDLVRRAARSMRGNKRRRRSDRLRPE